MRLPLLLILALPAAAGDEALDLVRALAGAPLATRDREILQKDERFAAHFEGPQPHLLPEVRQALDDPLSVLELAARLAREEVPGSGPPGDRAGERLYDEIPEVIRGYVGDVTSFARRSAVSIGRALAPLSPEEVAFLREALPRWVGRTRPEDIERANRGEEDVEERDRLLRAAALCAKVDLPALQKAAQDLLSQVVSLPQELRADWKGVVRVETDLGPIVVRGVGNDAGDADAFLLIDLGGDDEYTFPEKAEPRRIRILIDCGGNDLYLSRGPFAWGSALLGVSILLDVAGNDDYRGRDWSLGCGLAGAGWLFDRAGDDRYYGGLGSQGIGVFGTGRIVDAAGDDEYVADCYCQGFGGSGGRGMLLDCGGDDLYLAGRDEEDIWRRPATYVTFAQGSAFSHRFGTVYKDEQGQQRFRITGQIPGGAGMLVDLGGNDRYLADVFGQGSAYWYSLGILYDGGGDDFYRATWYGQGVGTHCAVGCLLDAGGNDRYLSRTTSQGCGHDFSAGILRDLGGDDRYEGQGLCQGAGNALSGLGLLIDDGGDDAYHCDERCWGFGSTVDKHPEAAPFGFFLDRAGSNRYSGAAADVAKPGARWTQPPRGFGVDGK